MHDKLKSANYKNYLSSGQIINIASRMLFELNPKLVEHNIRTAYIAFSIFQNYKMPEECTLQNLVVLSLFHTVGFYRPDFFGYTGFSEKLDLFSEDDVIKDKYVFGSYYLQYMTHLKQDAKIFECFDQDFIPEESEKSNIAAYRELIYFSARLSFYYEENDCFPDDFMSLAPNKINPKIVHINTTEETLSLEDSILMAFLNLLGFDIIFFVPTGFQTIERFYNRKLVEEHQIGEYVYDLTVPNLGAIPSTPRNSWRDKIFQRGT